MRSYTQCGAEDGVTFYILLLFTKQTHSEFGSHDTQIRPILSSQVNITIAPNPLLSKYTRVTIYPRIRQLLYRLVLSGDSELSM